MIRLFDTHKIRKQVELEGLWQFAPMHDKNILPSEYKYTMPVPGCWEMHPQFLSYRGTAAYRKMIHIKEETDIRFEFKGVSHTAHIYFDGKFICRHYNAYTPFSFIIPDVTAGEHELVVVADNSFSAESALHIGNDYYTYGGIIRPVAMEHISRIYIERTEFLPFIEDGTWKAEIKVFVRSISNNGRTVTVEGELNGKTLRFGDTDFSQGDTCVLLRVFPFEGVESWDAGHPSLYLLELRLFDKNEGVCVDDLIERVGFRTVAIEEGKIKVNGNAVRIKGFNRHEDHGVCGCALPFRLMVKDIELMKDMGANAVRTSHYPNDEMFLDLCDEYGIYVWEENHARGLSIEQMENPHFEYQCENCNREMVQTHFNHPSIIIWGILNECANNTERGREIFQKQYDQIRKMDGSRPLTNATCHHFTDICLDLADIVSLNIYSSWYNDEDIEQRYLEIKKWADENGGEGKPVIISEFGAGGIYGFRDPSKVKWSEERQQEILQNSMMFYLGRKEICGVFIWQFCDCRVTEENGWFLKRPAARNNKGIVDLYRRPKLAYETVKRIFEEQS